MITRDQAVEQAGHLWVQYAGKTTGLVKGLDLAADAVKVLTTDGEISVPREHVVAKGEPAPQPDHPGTGPGITTTVTLVVELRFLLSVIQTREQLRPAEIARIRSDIHDAVQHAKHLLGPEKYEAAEQAAKDRLNSGPTTSATPPPPRTSA